MDAIKINYPYEFRGVPFERFREVLPNEIPIELLEPYREQLELNHSHQTIERMAERGGYSPGEIYLAVRGWGVNEMETVFEFLGIAFIVNMLGNKTQ